MSEVIARMRQIDAELPSEDGVAVFNRVYLTVTERIGELLADPDAGGVFSDPETMHDLDVRFANLWLDAVAADAVGSEMSPAWRPLFEARGGGRLPIQYALAGMNTHIEHDLAVAVVETCTARGSEPEDLHADYEAVNDVLAQVESEIRRSFLSDIGQAVDDRVGPVVHLVSAWNIDKARDLTWVTAQTMWALRDTRFLGRRHREGLAHTVGLATRVLLTPTAPLAPAR